MPNDFSAPTGTRVGRRRYIPKEFKVVSLRECPLPEYLQTCDTPDAAAAYWRMHIETTPNFQPDKEWLVTLLLNTRRKVKGHEIVSMGTMDTTVMHPREVFRSAVIAGASAIVIMHNHPSGEPHPSVTDITVTRELIRGGRLLKIEVLDHVIIGRGKHVSLRESGYFCD